MYQESSRARHSQALHCRRASSLCGVGPHRRPAGPSGGSSSAAIRSGIGQAEPLGFAVLGISDPPGRLTVRDADLRTLIKNAFQIRQDVDLIGGPRWIETESFDIAATAPEKTSYDQVLLMLQSLLFERFKLRCASRAEAGSGVIMLSPIATGASRNFGDLKAGNEPRDPSGPDLSPRVINILW